MKYIIIITLLSAQFACAFFKDAYVKLDPTAEAEILKAQKYIAKSQKEDGSWHYGKGNTGVQAYCILALMVNGSVPGEGEFGTEVAKGVQYLVNIQKDNGLLVGKDGHGVMYQHALATLALAECMGMSQNPKLRSALIRAINLIVDTQHDKGGWRYEPKRTPGDISVTVMQVMALRAAVEAGIYVPDETIERAIKFIKYCYNKNQKGFGYTNGHGSAAFARTGAGLVCLQSVGLHEDPIIPDVVGYIMENCFKEKKHFWYGHYYTSVGLYHYGGDQWKSYYPQIRSHILEEWKKKKWRYPGYLDTSWQILILGVPYRYLPIYQR